MYMKTSLYAVSFPAFPV